MVDVQGHKLPLGMRLNNPGNLKAVHHMVGGVDQHGDFAKFDTQLEGTFALVKLCVSYYTMHGLLTLDQFIQRYAPATENDVNRYEVFVCRRTGLNIMHVRTQDLMLNRAWRALDFMRAIVAYEQGSPYTEWSSYPEWINLDTWRAAMLEMPIWKGQI